LKPNIIFVLLDGSRFDRIHVSPEFSDLIKQGTLLDNVTTAIPYTFGSINVILTGEYGKENGVDGFYKVSKLKKDIPFLPEILQNEGYFTSRGLIRDEILSPRGFDFRRDYNEYEEDLNLRHPELIKDTFEKAGSKPFFTLLQFTRIHTVTVTEVLKKYEWNDENFYKNKDDNLQTYDNVFKETGIYAKLIKNTIEELGISENTVIIFFTDHGTGIGERFGERNYGSFTFEETLRTFYLFIGSKIISNQKSDKLLSTIDIFPTILELCGIKINQKKIGASFHNFLIGKQSSPNEKEFTFSETGALHGPYPSPEISNVFCIKTKDFKLMHVRDVDEWKMYNLHDDPNETVNIIDSGLKIEKILKEKLLEWINR
tara:strand:+ start:316 stop:1431 length:1116 start_codon:yes stop_codon:yes gene_type:complete